MTSEMNRTKSGKGLRLGIDGEALRRPLSGIGRYVFELCRELEILLPDAKFFAYSRLPAERLALPSSRWFLRQEPLTFLRRLPSFLWLRTRGAKLCRRDALDVFWAGRTLHPRLGRTVRTVVTVHDLNHRLVPETMEFPTRLSHRLWFDTDVRCADVVVANSRGTADRLASLVGRTADAVVMPGVGSEFKPLSAEEAAMGKVRLAQLGIRPPYLLSVATLEPRKNVEALFDAFLRLKGEGLLRKYQLVLAGSRGWAAPKLERRIASARDKGVIVPGYVRDELMPALYGCAEALVCPSLYEGFGMPVLEARACGTPVIVSDVPELLEAAGKGARVVNPTVDGIANGIRETIGSIVSVEPAWFANQEWYQRCEILVAELVPGQSLTKS